MEYLIGIDVGTSALKAVLMSYSGEIKNVKTKKSTYYFENDMKLMNAEVFCENCFEAISELADELSQGDSIEALCVSGAGGNLMLVKDGKSCSPVYGWQTKFPAEETEKSLSSLSKDDVYKTVGWPKLQGFPLAGLAYLKQTTPSLINSADTACMHIEYLNYKLTGNWAITRSMGTTFFLIDQEKGEYCKEYLDLLEIAEDKLMPIVDNCTVIGKINEYASKKTGLKAGTPVIAGSFDHPAAARGAGVIKENEVLVSCGTYADEDGNVAPITWGRSLGGHFMTEFYMSFREDLRPPLKQMHYYTNENINYYSDMIAEEGDGGADLIISATGWIGHTAFIDPHTKAFKADNLEDFLKIKAGFVDNHRLTIQQNSGATRALWHTPRYSVSIGPWDVIHAREHLERHDLQSTGGYSSWERMISRLQLYGPVCMEVPASIYQLTKGTIYVSEDMARPIEPMDFYAL